MITGTANDPAPTNAHVGAVEVQIGDPSAAWLPSQVYPAAASNTHIWAYTWALPDADNQPYLVRARAIDEAGNIGNATA